MDAQFGQETGALHFLIAVLFIAVSIDAHRLDRRREAEIEVVPRPGHGHVGVAGGLAQNLSFIFGMKALLIIATLVYGSAAILQTFKLRSKLA